MVMRSVAGFGYILSLFFVIASVSELSVVAAPAPETVTIWVSLVPQPFAPVTLGFHADRLDAGGVGVSIVL